jgi:sugar/nucleoside kinase (ribokinase family)
MTGKELHYDIGELRYTGIIGTGGIGSGKFFRLNGNHTLGREESRSGHFLDIRDYCKQHIILHYVKVLLGRGFQVIPIGRVGDDDIGNSLIREMKATGLTMDFVERVPDLSTLFSFCFTYPDNSGGNLTTDNSASATVNPGYIARASDEIKRIGPAGMIMAAPEVPLSARYALLQQGRENGLYCAASFTSEEAGTIMESGILECIDLIALNLDEAAALAGSSPDQDDPLSVAKKAMDKLQAQNGNIKVSVTAGKHGSYCWDGNSLNFRPSVNTTVISTAGAGDAFFSGLICGIALDVHLFEAQQLATLVAGLSVTSPDTIHKGIGRSSLRDLMKRSGPDYSEKIKKLLED